MELDVFMKLALDEARESLREGNKGFGAVVVRNGEVIASSHDREVTDNDPTSHAEMNVIRETSRKIGRDLSECFLISTHEPCPMCASAIVWSKIPDIAFGVSIRDAIRQGRRRIDFGCQDVFRKAEAHINIYAGVLQDECSVLYRDDVRSEIARLRGADDHQLNVLNEDSIHRRMKWFDENKDSFDFISHDLLDSAYRLLLERFRIGPEEAPVVSRTDRQIVFHSMNFCPTLEVCKILNLDTRYVCKRLNEDSTDTLIKQIDGGLKFSRNYEKLRPYTDYCEEMISR